MKNPLKSELCIIGGNVTGISLVRDLAMRGVDCIPVEKRDINAVASERYIADFPEFCARCGIPVMPLDIKEAGEMETALSEKVIAA